MSETTAKNAIVVGVDGSAGSDAAIRWAVGEATLRAAPIILVHVVAPLVVAWPVGRIQGNITRWQHDGPFPQAALRTGYVELHMMASMSHAWLC